MSDAAAAAGKDGLSLKAFTDIDRLADVHEYVVALEAFDALREIQQLKALGRTGIGPGQSVLDVGCGFGLETARLARLVAPGGRAVGLDHSAAFVAEARRRAAAAGIEATFEAGDARALPFADASFDASRAERVLIYISDPEKALAELRRVTRPGGMVALIEPDFDSNAINLSDRAMTRRVLAHECDTGVVNGWLVRDLARMLRHAGFRDVHIDTRIVLFTPDLAHAYFGQLGRAAREAGVISAAEAAKWQAELDAHYRADHLFATIGYYLFRATAA
jgi:SAM-dependent methyltransferase